VVIFLSVILILFKTAASRFFNCHFLVLLFFKVFCYKLIATWNNKKRKKETFKGETV